ncbi:MAG TPA: ankyrin repeat domain-containing protein [Tepidisphaeraceae bacterium]|jgi:hypothetical protein|nr:ankyrin repeat domain-containing protein [Tepidisphaeraceae bacterium]
MRFPLVLLFALMLVGCAAHESPMHLAARNGVISELASAKSAGGDVNGRSPDNKTPLMLAAEKGHAGATEWLIDNGADVGLGDSDHDTALHYAARFGSTEAADVLLKRGANLEAVNDEGATPLLLAATDGYTDTADELLNHGAKADARNKEGWTALMYVSRDGYAKIAKALLAHGADVNAANPKGKTPAELAQQENHRELAAYLKGLATTRPATLPATSPPPTQPAARATHPVAAVTEIPDTPARAATLPAPADELNLLAMGDWGEGVPAQKQVAGAMADYVAANGGKFSGLLSAGDNFYVPLTGVDDPVWQNLFEKMYDPQRLNFPFYIALGNHDYDQKKFQIEFDYAKQHPDSRWKQPGRWFRVDLPKDAPLATVIILDSNHDDLTPLQWNLQKKFLEEELSKPRAPWTICVAHHPLFSNGFAADNGILQRDWGTLFKKYHVDIYLCGHDHTLQHLEIPNWKTSFVIAGGGGAHSHPMRTDDRGPFSRSIYGFVHFDFTPEKVVVHYIGADGKPVHVFERSKGHRLFRRRRFGLRGLLCHDAILSRYECLHSNSQTHVPGKKI